MDNQSCQGIILNTMKLHSVVQTQWLVSDLTHLIGYEAGTRIGDLCRKGLVHRSGTKVIYEEDGVTVRNRFALYSLTETK